MTGVQIRELNLLFSAHEKRRSVHQFYIWNLGNRRESLWLYSSWARHVRHVHDFPQACSKTKFHCNGEALFGQGNPNLMTKLYKDRCRLLVVKAEPHSNQSDSDVRELWDRLKLWNHLMQKLVVRYIYLMVCLTLIQIFVFRVCLPRRLYWSKYSRREQMR